MSLKCVLCLVCCKVCFYVKYVLCFGVFKAFFGGEVGKYCSCVMIEIRRCQSLRVTSFGTSPRPDGLGIIVGFGSRITLLGSKNSCKTITPFMSLLLVHVSRGPLCTYPSTLCVYHPPI